MKDFVAVNMDELKLEAELFALARERYPSRTVAMDEVVKRQFIVELFCYQADGSEADGKKFLGRVSLRLCK